MNYDFLLQLFSQLAERVGMNVLEQFAIQIVLGLVQLTIKNPGTAVKVKTQLLTLADDIYIAYGLTPPTHT